jgi:hypothetical protein
MPSQRQKNLKADLAWFAICFVGLQVGLAAAIDWKLPRLYDEEYGVRLAALRARQAAEPDRPLLLVVGTSRVGMGFAPELLPELCTPSGQRVLPFNFSHLASGPVLNLMLVRRLLAQGIHPQWLVLELVPGSLAHESPSMPSTNATAPDLPVACRYFPSWRILMVYARQRLVPWHKHRAALLRQVAPDWAPYHDLREKITLNPLGGDRGWLLEPSISPAEVQRRTAQVRDIYFDMFQRFHIDPAGDRATRELLELCRREHIPVTLFTTPESSTYRSWYSPAARQEVDAYLARLGSEYGVVVCDTRTWLADSDFTDSHHPLQQGAEHFTRRFGREVLEPLVQGHLEKEFTTESQRAQRKDVSVLSVTRW